MTTDIELEDGFPKSDEFFIPVLKVLSDGNYTEEEISNKLGEYFHLTEEQRNQRVQPRNNNENPNTKLKSYTHFAIFEFERFNCIKRVNNIYSIESRGKQILNLNIKKLKKRNVQSVVSRLDILRVLEVLSNLKLDVTFIHLSKNGIRSSQADAKEHFQAFLKRNDIHNYDNQEVGDDYKKVFTTYFYNNDEEVEIKTSLYRASRQESNIYPPRVWFPGIDKNLIKPRSTFLIYSAEKIFYIFNLSDTFTLNSILSRKGKPYEILKEESNKKLNKNFKTFFKRLKKLNDRRYILLNSDNPDINAILKKEALVQDSQIYSYNNIDFNILNENNKIFDNEFDKTLFNLNLNVDDDYVIECNKEYLSKTPIHLSNINPTENLKLVNDYENGLLNVIDKDMGNVLSLKFEDILYNTEEKFYLVYNNKKVYNSMWVSFDKILSYSKPNFSILSFFLLDDDFKSLLDKKIELILDVDLKENLLSCSLRLELNDENIIKKLLYPDVFNLKNNF